MHLIVVKLAAIGDLSITIQSLSLVDLSTVQVLDIITDNELVPLANYLVNQWKLNNPQRTESAHLASHCAQPTIRVHGINAKALFNKHGRIDQIKSFLKLRRMIGALKRTQERAKKVQSKTLVVVMHRDQRYRWLGADAILNHQPQRNEYDAQRDFLLGYFPHRTDTHQHASKTNQTDLPKNNELRIGIFLGGGQNAKTQFSEKSYPRFHELISELVAVITNSSEKIRAPNLSIILFGSPDDSAQANKILGHRGITTSAKNSITDYTGQCSLPELCEHLKTLDVYIGTDSGPSHLAAQLLNGTPSKVFVLFGPTNPNTWAPTFNQNCHVIFEKLPCSPCYQDDGNFKRCHLDNNLLGDQFQLCMKQIDPKALAQYVLSANHF